MPWSVKPCLSHLSAGLNAQAFCMPCGFLVSSWISLTSSSSFVTYVNPLLSDVCIVSWGEQCKMVDLPVSGMDVQGVSGLWLFERAPSPASGLGIPAALKKPVRTQDTILRTSTETQPSSPKMVSQLMPKKSHSVDSESQLEGKDVMEVKADTPLL